MNTNSKSSAFLLLAVILAAIVLAKLFWSIINFKYLPKTGINKEEIPHIKTLYYRYNLASKKEKPKIIAQKPKPQTIKKPKKPELITKFSLKGIIYSKTTQLATVTYLNKDAVLSPGDEFEGYILKKVYPTYVIFSKENKEYRLELYKNNQKTNNNSSQPTTPTPQAPKPQIKKAIYKEGDTTIISKSIFNKYKSNLKLIQQNIGVVPLYSGKKLTGFRVSYIKKGSDFEKLGLKRGDIIKAVNGEELNSFEVPIRIFNNLDSMSAATITIQRGSQIKELEYEVH